ncbi:DOCKER domain-containing protein [Entamoeba marina]
MNAAEEWYLSERKYIQETLTLNEWTTWVKLIKRIHVHETGVTVPVITKIVEDIGKFGDDVTSRLEECVNLQSSLQKVIDDERFGQKKVLGRRRTTRKSLMIEDRNLKRTSSRELEDNQDKVFGCIEGENSFVGGILKRLEKTVAVTQKDFVQVQQKWELIAQKEKYKNIVREKAVSVWEEAKIQKKINWSQLKELLMEGIDEVIQYDDTVDLISDEPKYNTPMSEQNKTQTTESKILLKPPQPKIGISINRASQPDHSKPRERSASASKGTRRQYRKSKSSIAISGPITEAAVVDDFIQSDQFVSDAFLDVNLYRLTQYKSAMKKLQKDITQILCKRQQLDKEKELSRDPDAYAERNLHFARDYLDAPRLHLEWFEKICEENKVRGRFLEGGLCKVHIICFIASFLKDGEAFKELHQIAPDNAEIILQHTTDTYNEEDSKQQKTDTFTEKDLKHHLDEAYQLFTMKHTEDFALLFLQSVISYFEATHNYSQLQLFHEKLTAVYNKKMGYVKSDIHFYYVAFYGEAFAGLENKEFIYQSADSIEGITEVIIGIAPLKEKKNVKVLERGAVASSILPGSLCVKVEEVTPVFDDYETTNTLTTNHFMSQYVHNLKDGHVDELSIRRIVYETKQKLPSAIRRERITGKVKDVFMSPFESSLDKIDTLAFQLQKAIIPPITEELTDILKKYFT